MPPWAGDKLFALFSLKLEVRNRTNWFTLVVAGVVWQPNPAQGTQIYLSPTAYAAKTEPIGPTESGAQYLHWWLLANPGHEPRVGHRQT